MKSPLLFAVLSIFFLSPLSTHALTNPYKPYGSEDNPLYFQEMKTDQQTIKEIDQSINETVQKAQDLLRRGSDIETRRQEQFSQSMQEMTQQLLQRSQVPAYNRATIEQMTADMKALREDIEHNIDSTNQPSSLEDVQITCIEQWGKWRNGRCVTQDTACKIDYGPHAHATGISSCGCDSGYAVGTGTEICVPITKQPEIKPSFFRRLLALFGL